MKRRKFLQGAGATAALATLPLPLLAQDERQSIATRPIPASGEPLPVVGYGSSSIFAGDDFAGASQLLDTLRHAGGKFIDTWSGAQATFGRYAREHAAHDELFLATNIRTATEASDLTAIEAAKEAQDKPQLDMLQLARPNDFRAQWQRVRRWKEEGHAKYIGLALSRSSMYGMVEAAIIDGADFVQINYSMLEQEAGERLIPLAHDNGVAVITNRPFVNGQYFPMIAGKELPEWAAEFDCHSWAQFSLKWILGNPLVNCAITETSKVHHAVDNLSAGLGRFPDDAERVRMQAHLRSL
jgi:diketogulonate reductase-like aldo/keto reductase